MFIIKVLLSGLIGFSLCMADIGGIVTDTSGITPLSGAAVKLEKGGQTATTGADGRFTLLISTAILPRPDNQFFRSKLSATIHNSLLQVNVVEKSAVEITIFNYNGKALSTVHRIMDIGTYSLTLPHVGAGVYLYKVKSGSNELVLKNNSIGGVLQGADISGKGAFSANALVKQTKTSAEFNDVIAVTKTGYLNYRVIAYASDTSGMKIKMIMCAGTVPDADGNVYQTVKIGNQEWMAENLRTTKYNDGTSIPFDTATTTWDSATTAKYCYSGNTVNADIIKKFGALYNWHVVNPSNPKKIAPTGWHVPADAEWDTLQNYLIANGYNLDGTTIGNTIAISMKAMADWEVNYGWTKLNSSGFSALPAGLRNADGVFGAQYNSSWWSVTENDASSAFLRHIYFDFEDLNRSSFNKSYGLTVRLVKD
jgi:uncharacterized protein (TIGR02145 family)